jgi:tetratricopeptide (TPR) repeat protein
MAAGDLPLAEDLLQESVQRHRDSADTFHLAWSLNMLGNTLLQQERSEEARARFEESLRLLATSGDVSAVVLHLAAFARLAALDDDVEREVRLVGALRRLRDLTGTDLVTAPLNQLPTLPATLERLGADGERLLAEGAAEVVRYALHETPGSDLSG